MPRSTLALLLLASPLTAAEPVTRLAPRARSWHRQVSAAFLDEYRATAAGAKILPARPEEFATLLDRYALGKAFFELNYELNNRPDWVHIPLQGVLDRLGAETTMNGNL